MTNNKGYIYPPPPHTNSLVKTLFLLLITLSLTLSFTSCKGSSDEEDDGDLKKVSITIGNKYSKTLKHIKITQPGTASSTGGTEYVRYEQDVNIGSPVTIEVSLKPSGNPENTWFAFYFTFEDGSVKTIGTGAYFFVPFTDFPQTYTIADDGKSFTDKNGKKESLSD